VIPAAGAAKIARSLAPWQLNRALELFEANLDRPIRLGEVADAVRLSASHFSRAFHQSVGEPPARYLRRQRVKRAQEMLLLTSRSITEIALNCGFSDHAHFTRTFRHMVGLPPAVWRRAFSDGVGLASQPRLEDTIELSEVAAHGRSAGQPAGFASLSSGVHARISPSVVGSIQSIQAAVVRWPGGAPAASMMFEKK
jgi:AraC-like DNA-binding protein